MTIKPYDHSMKAAFVNMLTAYFPEINADIPEDIIKTKLADFIEEQISKEIIQALLLYENGVPAGFSLFQIDTPDSDWCKWPGWGFIREFYILPQFRHKGLGRKLAEHSQIQMQTLGATRFYLTSDAAQGFWAACGWKHSEKTSSNGLLILEK